MKCTRCGADLKEGCLFCSICGHEVQMVSGYSDLEDEYLRSILAERESTQASESENKRKRAEQPKEEKNVLPKVKNNKIPLVIVLCLLLVLIIAGISMKLYINHKNSNSYEYQMEMAKQEMADLNLENAMNYYKNALVIKPQDLTARLAMADILMQEKDYDSAMVLLIEVINLDSLNKDAYARLVNIYAVREEYEKINELASNITNEEILALFEDYLVEEPVFYPDAGEYDSYLTVTVLSIEDDEIYYTMDGTEPSVTNGMLYPEEGINLDASGMYLIKAVCCNEKGVLSDVVEAEYKVVAKPPAYPEVLPDGGTFEEVSYVTIEIQEDCTAYYTWDGTDPTEASAVYLEPIEIPEGNNVLSIVVIDNRSKLKSEIYRANFIYEPESTEEL